jgi:TolA-binding protein
MRLAVRPHAVIQRALTSHRGVMPMRNPVLAVAIAGLSLALPGVAAAQSNVEMRVGRLEGEMRAVQRKVFPGGAGSLVLPDVSGPARTSEPADGTPATSAVADLTERVGSLERQVATLTGQVEQNGYRLRQLQDQFDAFRRRTDDRLSAMATPAPASVDTGSFGDDSPPPSRAPQRPATRPAAKPVADTAPTPTATDKPSGDPAEDAYMAGYRLWEAKKYPEAEAKLKKVVADYPKHKRASYAQNLLGRAYLDEGKPSLASMAFYDNYKKMPDGERAPDSLYYLAQALTKLGKPADACKVYGELTDVYGTKIAAGMKANVERGRVAAKCR